MDTSVLDITSLILGIIIGFIACMFSNFIYNASEYLKYEVYKKEKEFKNKKKIEKENEKH